MSDKLSLIKEEFLKTAKRITKIVGAGDPLDGDETFALATLFNIELDYNNGNITEDEREQETEVLLDNGGLPIARKKEKKHA